MFVSLAFLIPLRIDFKWLLTQPILYVLNGLFLFMCTPASWLELLLNMMILVLMYTQAATASILAIFILNLKVFRYGCVKNVQSHGNNNSFDYARTEFQDAISYLNSTMDGTTENAFNPMNDKQMK